MTRLSLPKGHPYTSGRTCTDCGEFKTSENYSLERDSRAFGGITMRSKCKPCSEFVKYKASLKRRYGITYGEYCEILDSQNGSCAICNEKESGNSRTSARLFVDHCHETMEVRGLLCSRCNHGLGLFLDDTDRLQSAISYLNNTKEN